MKLCTYVSCLLAGAIGMTSAQASEILYDPTQPPNMQVQTSPPSQRSLRLESVLVSTQRKVATINGRHYQEGDYVSGGKLVSIHRRGVEIVMPDKTLTLQLRQLAVKRTRN